MGGTDYGLPRFDAATFTARLPFGMVGLSDAVIPLQMTITGWSPFIPGDADNSSLPVAALEYTFHNPTGAPVEAVFSFHARNFVAVGSEGSAVRATRNGFVLWHDGSEHDGRCASG